MNVLDQVISKATELLNQKVQPQFIFDLDSTIFCVSPRTELILKQFAQQPEIQQKYPETSEKLLGIEATPFDWGIKTILNRHNIKESLQFFEAAREYWVEHFFSSHHLHRDTPYSGAVEFVQYAKQLGIEVHYLTGRVRTLMGEGTVESLQQHHLPLDQLDRLNMKPTTGIRDVDYKIDVFKSWLSPLQNVWFFENEPVIINRIHQQFPDVNLIVMDSVHSGKETAPTHLPRLKFEWVFQKK